MLAANTRERTLAAVGAASDKLEQLIVVSLFCMAAAISLIWVAFLIVRRQVLAPIDRLSCTASKLSQGDYRVRVGVSHGVEEIEQLGKTFDSMACAIEEDLEHRKAVQKELEVARQVAEAATRAKSLFLANMSHAIRTPMNAIIGMAYLALKTDFTPRQQDYVSKIHQAARALLGIINDILDFSKVEAGKLALEHTRFRLEDVLSNALALLRDKAHEKEIELLFNVTDPVLLGNAGAVLGPRAGANQPAV